MFVVTFNAVLDFCVPVIEGATQANHQQDKEDVDP